MHRLQNLAVISVGRACGFAGLGVVAVMVGLAFDPFLSVKSGAILGSGIVSVLLYKAWRAPEQSYRQTELWLMLEAEDAPPESSAQQLIAGVLRDAYLRFATFTAVVAAILWLLALLLWWVM